MIESSAKFKQPWIIAGYRMFAYEGPQSLKVETIARQVNKSKSSFYHYFAELEIFTEVLLDHHLHQARLIAQKERACDKMIPDLIQVLLAHKEDLLFSRQLRIHRDNAAFKVCSKKTSEIVRDAALPLWADSLNLSDKLPFARKLLDVALENFYLRISPGNFSYEWCIQFLQEMKAVVKEIRTDE